MTRETVELGEQDSCVIFRQGGSQELRLPKQEDEEVVLPTAERVMLVVTFLDNADLVEEAAKRLLVKIEELDKEPSSD